MNPLHYVTDKMTLRSFKVGGITPFTATDYPGKLAFVIFAQGCPWRCSYCHNPHLQARLPAGVHAWADILSVLKRRIGLIDAVVFSGGEPTIDPALSKAISEVRQLGFEIGLHTACIYPRQLTQVLPLIDWVGFDIKTTFDRYASITGVADSGRQARACAEIIIASGVNHECRTTIHPALLTEEVITELALDLSGMGVKNYALQAFRAQGCIKHLPAEVTTPRYPSETLLAQIAPLFSRFIFRDAT